MVGLSKGRLAERNSRCCTPASTVLHGNMLPRRLDLAPVPAWVECLALIPKGSRAGYHLGRFARYATCKGIETRGRR
jgi:hypothetical protein